MKQKWDSLKRLREHGFGVVPIASFHLASTLESENDGILRFSILSNGGMKLWQTLQAGQLFDYKPGF